MAQVTRTAALAMALVFAAAGLRAQPSKASEYAVKAAYLYNFGRFVQWRGAPMPAGDSFPICVLGRDPFGAALDTAIAGATIDGRRAVARRIEQSKEASGCRIVFVSASEEGELAQILAALGQSRVVTVSDMPEFARRGGMIQFVSDGNRVRFEVNLASAEDAGLALSSELLKVAVLVRRRPGA
jgi:hypothetical protein